MNELKARQYQRTAIAAAVAGVAMSMGQAWAQEAPIAGPQTVVVTGVRAALEQ